MAQAQALTFDEMGSSTAPICFNVPSQPREATDWPSKWLRTVPARGLQLVKGLVGAATADVQTGAWLDTPASGSVALTEEVPRGRRISLAEARRIALAASLEAEKRWKAAAASEAAFYSVVLEEDPGEGR